MFCPKCGNQLPDGASFCGACGNALTNAPKHGRVDAAAPVQQNAYTTPPAQSIPVQPSAQAPYAAGPTPVVGASPIAAAAPAYGVQGGQPFGNARRGLKTMLHAQVLTFISAAITFVIGLTAVGSALAGASDLTGGLLGATGIAGVALAIIVIIAFIMKLVGLFRSSKDEKIFLWAFIATLAGLACNILVYVMVFNAIRSYDYGMIEASNGFSTLSSIITLAVYVLIFFGIMTLAKKIGNANVASMAMIMLIISAVAYLLTLFVPASSGPLYFIRLICAFVPDILLLVILLKANKMFA